MSILFSHRAAASPLPADWRPQSIHEEVQQATHEIDPVARLREPGVAIPRRDSGQRIGAIPEVVPRLSWNERDAG
ncbi:uncharacterized protein SOCEGT47_051710 [Sorangium cellulosum]|jgi:hypothetical protein|uniref:Uncharacterized protein n=1 Tax=Sorangium cellulosum TaxID=56 RepID=A0A4V0NE19_SORCE|nr:hypothetical protein [Sorangium cellulosum]AUX24632.1 uncharacterized protein SOCEGT47_051710 [Sorangium cellulosum]